MYIFSIKRNRIPLVEITIDEKILDKNIYLGSLIEKCFENVFQNIRNDNKEVDLEEEYIDFEEEVD